MALNPPALPINFPCWVRAQYSWGGEAKTDLGFLEGELIECLNAGDGSWWTGRLRRDPRKVGSFPSNFVEVLEESFQPPPKPASRVPSPNPSTQESHARSHKSFRKPFASYQHAPPPNPEAAAREILARNNSALNSPSGSLKTTRPHSSVNKRPEVRSNFGSQRSELERPRSQLQNHATYSRVASPRPDQIARIHALERNRRSFSSEDDSQAPPPPPPPPHKYANSRAPSPQPPMGPHTPEPHGDYSPQKHTPSPFTAAFDDIMDTFKDMTTNGDDTDQRKPEPQDERPRSIWSPDDFDKMYGGPKLHQRSHTAMAAPQTDSGYGTGFDEVEDKPEGSSHFDDYIPKMEKRLKALQEAGYSQAQTNDNPNPDYRPTPPAKDSDYNVEHKLTRPSSSFSLRRGSSKLKKQKSAYELGKNALSRTFTTKTNSTNVTDRSLMSASSIGNYSVKSAGSFYRRKLGIGKDRNEGQRPVSSIDFTSGTGFGVSRPQTPSTPINGISFSNNSDALYQDSSNNHLGGLKLPSSPKRTGFFKKMIDSARASAATARVTLSRPGSPQKTNSMIGISGDINPVLQSRPQTSASQHGGMGSVDWMQVRRDLYRSNTISRNERHDRVERCQMLDIPVIPAVDELFETAEGAESLDGLPVTQPIDFASCNLSQVDKSARFVDNLPPMTTPQSIVQNYLCRPYRSDVQRLRAIFTWVSERISWEEAFDGGEVDIRRVMQSKRGCSEEIAYLVAEMCSTVGIHVEIVNGLLKTPGEALDLDLINRPNHWWNTVIVDGEWRIMDCSLASPTNPHRGLFSTIRNPLAESFWFLTSPLEACFTHVPINSEQQHIVPSIPNEILLSLPCVCPSYFQQGIEIHDFDASLLHLEELEMGQLEFFVPDDIECVAEVETRAFSQDADGDYFENGEFVRKPALAQAEWYNGRKQFTIKALLPGDEGQGVLKIYAGKRGLMHSNKFNPHALVVALPITHSGTNPPYSFLTRHPTPQAQRHDLYVAQPQCGRLVANNTFVFSIRQHPSSLKGTPSIGSGSGFNPRDNHNNNIAFSGGPAGSASAFGGRSTPNPLVRPQSAMSMASISASGSNYSSNSNGSGSSGASSGVNVGGGIKPAKLAIQTPSGKIIRLTRKIDSYNRARENGEMPDGSEWETVIKVSERGVWRGLVLADRSARWCVFAEWECV